MLTSSRDHYRRQQRLTALAVRATRRAYSDLQVAAAVAYFQAESIGLALAAMATTLREQSINPAAVAEVVPTSLVTDRAAVREMLSKASNRAAVDRLAATLVQDAGRTASAVSVVTRPAVTAHVRMLNLPSCSRCAVLAGRTYKWSAGFQRHPLCDCVMVPTTVAAGTALTLDGREAALSGQVHGLSKAELRAIEHGADLGQVVNVHRKKAGLTVGSSVMDRAGRPTPAGILRSTESREQAIALLTRHGYIV